MAQELRTTQYWGAGKEAEFFRDAFQKQKMDRRFNGSAMKFIRYAVAYCLMNDKSLKNRPPSYPGGDF